MNKKIVFVLILVGLLAVSAASAQNSLFLKNNDDSMNQVSLMQAFMHGEYDGVVTVGDFKAHGDIGLGTFEGVNGEMIVLDGVVYQAAADGSINVMPDNETIPFGTVTFFDEDGNMTNITAKDFNDLTGKLDKEIEKYGIEPFIKKCKESVWKYKGEWEKMSDRVGYWADMEHPYITYDDNYIENCGSLFP